MVRSSTRRSSRRLRSCERQATEFEKGLQEAHKKRKVIILNDDSSEECIGNSLKAEWRELSRKALLQLGAKEMTALCQELDVVNSNEGLNSGVHSGGTNTTTTTAGGHSSLHVHDEDARARACHVEFERDKTELEKRYRATVLRSKERVEALQVKISGLERENDKQAKLLEAFDLRSLELRKHRLEESLPIPETSSRSPEGGRDSKGKDLEISILKDELIQVRAELEVSEFRLELERNKKEEVTEELIALQHQKAVSDVTKFELENEKQKSEIEKSELRELRGLRRTFEAERLELVELRCQMKEFEAMKNGHTDVCNRLACQERQLKAAEEELRSLRTKRETYDSAAQELSMLRQRKANYETAIQDVHDQLAMQETQLKASDKELQRLRIKRETYHAAAEELESKISLLRDLEAIQDWVKEKQLLEERLQQGNEQISSLQSRIERVENVKARLEEDSATQNRKLFLKEVKIESLMAKLRAKELTLEDEVSRSAKNYTAEEVETLREANRASMETERRLREELSAVRKQLVANASKDVCRICFTNARDTLHLPCSHVQCCVQCLKVMMQDKQPCPSCGRAITGFVRYNPVL
ncbi:hypothetical protein R1flu_000362 [Riccia fluitans]|uniref:RING-type domain-containing protein n=1 Tax=Riccia fluitans TaxID=41844 RepID=A0ABD1Y095_9MARC